MCNNIYRDNGTTFVGANNNLKDVYAFLKCDKANIADYLSQKRIDWHFISFNSHLGGIWGM